VVPNVYAASSAYDTMLKTDIVFTTGLYARPVMKMFIIADKTCFCDPSDYGHLMKCITAGFHRISGESPNNGQTLCSSVSILGLRHLSYLVLLVFTSVHHIHSLDSFRSSYLSIPPFIVLRVHQSILSGSQL
jgi:hypothetical protein